MRQFGRRRGLVCVVEVELVSAVAVLRPSVVVGDDEGIEQLLLGEVGMRAVHEVFRWQRRNRDSASVIRLRLDLIPSFLLASESYAIQRIAFGHVHPSVHCIKLIEELEGNNIVAALVGSLTSTMTLVQS